MSNRYTYDDEEEKRYIPDTSVIINGMLKDLITENKLDLESELIIHAAN